ncbi:MAG TPA: cytochrome c [Chitinophagaceae bacterium]
MKEIKYILHASLLLLTGSIIIICLKAVSIPPQSQTSSLVFIDNVKSIPEVPASGKQLFMANCASCHIISKNFVGPSLCGFEERGPWGERENVYQWIKNPQQFMNKNEYAKELREIYSGNMMMSFPNLTNEEINEIINYINIACLPRQQQVIAEN